MKDFQQAFTLNRNNASKVYHKPSNTHIHLLKAFLQQEATDEHPTPFTSYADVLFFVSELNHYSINLTSEERHLILNQLMVYRGILHI